MNRILMLLSVVMLVAASSCKKERNLIANNTPPDYSFIPTELVENYVNRMYLDMLGRNALDVERDSAVALLKDNKLNIASRTAVIEMLQYDIIYRDGDSSYSIAYYNRFYSLMKSRLLEGVEDDYLTEEIGNTQSTLNAAVAAGDSFETAKARNKIEGMKAVLNVRYTYRNRHIGIDSVHFLFINNWVYDQINMNTFNFVNATFDNLYYRFPTQEEYNTGYEMVENNQSGTLLGFSGSSRSHYLHIVTHCDAFYEGVVIWVYKSLLARTPAAGETVNGIPLVKANSDIKDLQKQIMIGDEYAHFN